MKNGFILSYFQRTISSLWEGPNERVTHSQAGEWTHLLFRDINKVILFLIKRFFITGKAWNGPTYGVWLSTTCPYLYSDEESSLEECKNACEEDRYCNAIEFNQEGGYGCYLRQCPNPVPLPDEFEYSPYWVGYYQGPYNGHG